MNAIIRSLVWGYVKKQLKDIEVELALRWSDGVPTDLKRAIADVKEAIGYVLTHGSRG